MVHTITLAAVSICKPNRVRQDVQNTQAKHQDQAQPLRQRQFQFGDLLHRHDDEDDICEDGEGRIRVPQLADVDAVAGHCLLPCLGDRTMALVSTWPCLLEYHPDLLALPDTRAYRRGAVGRHVRNDRV